MKMWKRYLASALALLMIAAVAFYLPRIHGETAAEETSAASDPIATEPVETEPLETEPIETEPIETEPPETLDNAGDATDDNMNPPKLTLVPRELTDEELKDEFWMEIVAREGSLLVTNAEGKTLRVEGDWPSGTMEILFRYFTNYPYTHIFEVNPSSSYTITGDIGTENIYFVWNGHLYENVCGSGIESIMLTRDGISLQGTNMSCEIYRNEEHSDHKTILRTENASRAVLKYEDGQFLLWSDGAYSIEVYDNWSGATLLGQEVEADSVFCVQDVSSDAPTCHRVDTAE